MARNKQVTDAFDRSHRATFVEIGKGRKMGSRQWLRRQWQQRAKGATGVPKRFNNLFNEVTKIATGGERG